MGAGAVSIQIAATDHHLIVRNVMRNRSLVERSDRLVVRSIVREQHCLTKWRSATEVVQPLVQGGRERHEFTLEELRFSVRETLE
jgi:hypothetical protein